MRGLAKIINRVKFIFPILTGKSIIIQTNSNKEIIVNAGNLDKDTVKLIAARFFKESYNLG